MVYTQNHREAPRGGNTGARPFSAVARNIERLLAHHARTDTHKRAVSRNNILHMLDRVARPLGLNDGELNTLKGIAKRTRPEDWADGATPVAWPSNQTLADEAGKTVGALKARIRKFRELGLVRMHDSANGKRRGERDSANRIIEAYGFDLSPLRARYAELIALAEAHDADTKLFNTGKRAIARVRRMVGQATVQAAELGLTGQHWVQIRDAIEAVVVTASAARSLRDAVGFQAAIVSLEAVENRLLELVDQYIFLSSNDPKGSENEPHIHIQNILPDSVQAGQDRSSARSAISPSPTPIPTGPSTTTIKTTPIEIAAMFPASAGYIPGRRPDWADVCKGAAILRSVLGIRSDTWVEASSRMGREGAAVAVLITCERQARGEIKRTAGAYFAGMVEKARKGELDLAKTLWGFRTTQDRLQ